MPRRTVSQDQETQAIAIGKSSAAIILKEKRLARTVCAETIVAARCERTSVSSTSRKRKAVVLPVLQCETVQVQRKERSSNR